jgi:hypothetical protein
LYLFKEAKDILADAPVNEKI